MSAFLFRSPLVPSSFPVNPVQSSETALAPQEALARAVRFQPGALRDDAMSPRYDLPAREGAREEPSGVEPNAHPSSDRLVGRVPQNLYTHLTR